MHSRVFIGIGVILAAGVALAQAYKWVDEDGVVHYSDRPHEGAEIVVLPESSPRPARAAPGRTPSPSATDDAGEDDSDEASASVYESLSITSPGSEETLWNIGGTLDVTLNLQPGLRRGHRVRVYLDGEAQMVNGTSFTLDEVFRGVHNIQAEVVDSTGQLQIRSETNRFYVQQTSVQNPRRPGPR